MYGQFQSCPQAVVVPDEGSENEDRPEQTGAGQQTHRKSKRISRAIFVKQLIQFYFKAYIRRLHECNIEFVVTFMTHFIIPGDTDAIERPH